MNIPTYNSKGSLTTEPSQVLVSPDAMSSKGQMVQELGKTVGGVAEKFVELRDLQQMSAAETERSRRLGDLEVRMSQDPDIYNIETKAKEEIRKIHDDTVAYIANPLMKERYSMEYNNFSAVRLQRIRDDSRRRQIDLGQATIMQATETDKEEYFGAVNPKEKGMIKDRIHTRIDEGVRTGIFAADAAMKYKIQVDHEINVGQVESDMAINPAATLQGLQKGKLGPYADLKTEDRTKLMSQAEEKMRRNEREAHYQLIQAQNSNESAMVDKWFEGTLTEKEVEYGHLKGFISDGFATSMVKNLRTPKVINAKTNPAVYDELMSKIMNPEVKASEIRKDILRYSASGDLSEPDRRSLLYIRKGDNEKSVYEDYLKETGPGFWGTAWKMVDNFFRGGNQLIKTAVMTNIINTAKETQAKPEQVPALAQIELQKQNIQKHAFISTLPEKGQLRVDIYGNKAMVYPDGRVEVVGKVVTETPATTKENE